MADFSALDSRHSVAVSRCFDPRRFYPLTLPLAGEGQRAYDEGGSKRGRPTSQVKAGLFTPPTSLLFPLASSTAAVPWRDADGALSERGGIKACF